MQEYVCATQIKFVYVSCRSSPQFKNKLRAIFFITLRIPIKFSPFRRFIYFASLFRTRKKKKNHTHRINKKIGSQWLANRY